jgi:hypothetical protein
VLSARSGLLNGIDQCLRLDATHSRKQTLFASLQLPLPDPFDIFDQSSATRSERVGLFCRTTQSSPNMCYAVVLRLEHPMKRFSAVWLARGAKGADLPVPGAYEV